MSCFRRVFVRSLAALALLTIILVSPALCQQSVVPTRRTCSPAPCVLPSTQISSGNEVADAAIAADQLRSNHLLLGSSDGNCQHQFDATARSSWNSGSTWATTCMGWVQFGDYYYVGDGGPLVAFDRAGTAYIGGSYQDTNAQSTGLIATEKSSDGTNWTDPVVSVAYVYRGAAWYDARMAVDTFPGSPYVDRIYISAIGLIEPLQRTHKVVVSLSKDGGTRWKVVSVTPGEAYPATDSYTSLAIGRNGTAYLTWMYCHAHPSCDTAYMVFSKSTDGGETWSPPTVMTSVNVIPALPPDGTVVVTDTPVIGVDNSNGPNAGTLYVVMYNWTGTFMQLQVIHSTDGGDTWSQPVAVAPGYNHDQFFPWLSVSSQGLVGVSWLDRRNDPANVRYQAFAAISVDGGHSFQPNVQLTDQFSDPHVNGFPFNTWMGNNTGNAWDGPLFLAAWMDSSNGVNMQQVLGGVRLK